MVTRVVTPRVEMYARQHFAVAEDDFPGVEIEDNGGTGTVGSHWERRVMGTELMTGNRSALSSIWTSPAWPDRGFASAGF
jgi:leishmanolysin